MAGYLFISYSRKDQTYVRQLADDLRKHSFEVWSDDRIDFGDRWWQTIVDAIHHSAALIVVMTPDSEESEWVEREVQLALHERKPVFPLLLRGTGFSLLVTRQYVKVTDGSMPPQGFYDRLRQVVPSPSLAESPAAGPEREEDIPTRKPFEPEMTLVPTADFWMGSDPAKDPAAEEAEQPQHVLRLPAYFIATTPITNAQYLAFVQATSYLEPSHWKNGKPTTGEEQHPVVHVSWHDAVAYCHWISEVSGRSYHVPSEAEWEQGARGVDGRLYPWGDRWDIERCNTSHASMWATTPVNGYPQGASPYGLLDMAGNVWEWTRSLYERYPYVPTDGREDPDAPGRRVLRGGSFGYDARFARCAFRLRLDPDNRGRDIGFRVVTSPAPDPAS